jgi:tetratricopeptide (TPR) repeat protein
MKIIRYPLAVAFAVIIPSAAGRAQSATPRAEYHVSVRPGGGWGTTFAWNMAALREDDKTDAGYTLYKEGYALILEEKYPAARKKFEELLAKFPRSSYADDARYWTAFSLRDSDREKAIGEYRKFLKEHPKSTYYDDAVADLNALQIEIPDIPGRAAAPAPPGLPRHPVPVANGPNMELMFRQMKRDVQHMSRIGAMRAAGPFAGMHTEEKLDDATRLKMDALYALGETKEDDKAFSALRDVALDTRQVRPVREAAMDALSGFTKHDALSVFVEIAQKDTSADLQGFAIDYIGEHGADKNQRVAVLEDLFRSLPKSRAGQRKTILYTIADIGNDRAVDFLKTVALTD